MVVFRWKPIEDKEKIRNYFKEFIELANDMLTPLRDKKVYIIYPEKVVEATPLRFVKDILFFSTSDNLISKGKNEIRFFHTKKRLLFKCIMEISGEDNKFWGKMPKKLYYYKVNEIYKFHKLLQQNFIVYINKDNKYINIGNVVDISVRGITIFVPTTQIDFSNKIDELVVTFFPYLSLKFKDLVLKDRRGFNLLLLFEPQNVQPEIILDAVNDEKLKKRLVHYKKIFNFQRFLEDLLITEIRKIERVIVKMEKEDIEKKKERIDFYFGSKYFLPQENEKKKLINNVVIFEIPLWRYLSKKLKGSKDFNVYCNLDGEITDDILKKAELIFVEYRYLAKNLSSLKTFYYKIVLMYDTIDAANAPSFAERLKCLSALSYSQIQIYTYEQLVQSLEKLLTDID